MAELETTNKKQMPSQSPEGDSSAGEVPTDAIRTEGNCPKLRGTEQLCEVLIKIPDSRIELPDQDSLIMRRINFHSRLRNVVGYLEKNQNDSTKLESIARVACMEKSAFSRFFRRATGVGFHEFLLAWRIQSALKLFTTTDRSLTEIAYDVGFQNLTTFERAFKKYFGCTPSYYRVALLKQLSLIP